MFRSLPMACFCAAAALPLPGEAAAQTADRPLPAAVLSAIDGAPPPPLPATMTRDSLGRATIRAIRLAEPLVLDGRLDESVYRDYLPAEGFIQATPVHGAPSTERTEVWVMYDEDHIYLACRCWDSAPPERWVVNEYRRDSNGLRQNDHFGVMFDTFYDRRNGFAFYANPLGARADYSVVDEGGPNSDWNPVWDVRSERFDGGWTMEMAIPFKSLRYRAGPDQLWGIQLRRSIRHKGEWTYLNPVPASLAGPQALNRVSSGGTLVGLDLPSAGRNVELRPYALGGLSTDRVAAPAGGYERRADVGVDFKYGVTSGLTADLTFNTDFAQVEIDEQQVNLTRFSLFFPEKREFFLEGRGVFDFGRGTQRFTPGAFTSDVPFLFYSRRIGLERGRVVPIVAGGRLTGKAGPFGIGLVNIQTQGEEELGIEPTNFSVVRLKRDILRRSSVGMILTNRSVSVSGEGSNQAYGLDATFSFYENVRMGGYWARTETTAVDGDGESWLAAFDWNADRWGFGAERLKVGDAFNPEVGFARRRDFVKSSVQARFSPRPTSLPSIRQFTWEVGVDHFENGAGRLESREQSGRFEVELESTAQLSLRVARNREVLFRPFQPGPGVEIAPGAYDFSTIQARVQLPQQWRVAGTITLERGGFYDGTLTGAGVTQGRVVLSNRLSLEPGITWNRVEFPEAELRRTLLRTRVDYAFTPRMFAGTLLQYDHGERALSSNLRYRWEYRPGSELFVVWTDERNTGPRGGGLRNRALILKVTRLLQY